jgi:hypothetical protein
MIISTLTVHHFVSNIKQNQRKLISGIASYHMKCKNPALNGTCVTTLGIHQWRMLWCGCTARPLKLEEYKGNVISSPYNKSCYVFLDCAV